MTKPKCLHCSSDVQCRGLCDACYRSACILIKKKETSWEWLIEKGLAKGPKTKGRKSKFNEAFEKVKGE